MSCPNTVSQPRIVDNLRLPTGSRDDDPHGVDLPLVDLVAQAPLETSPRFRNWPDLQTRLQWADDVGCALTLTHRERAVLWRVCWRAGRRTDGKSPGCIESAANMGAGLGYHRSHVGTALQSLVKKGLLEKVARFHNTNIYRPTFQRVNVTKRDIDMSQNATLTRKQPEGVDRKISKSLMLLEDIEPGRIVDNADSCGFVGCPPLDHICPMCGRQGAE